MLVEGRWLTGVSDQKLAEEHGLSVPRIRAISSESARMLRLLLEETDESKANFKARAFATFERLAQKAEDCKSAQGYGVALEAVKTHLEYLGMQPPKKVVNAKTADEFGDWTEEELAAFVERGEKPKR
jgi:hypothetical protein